MIVLVTGGRNFSDRALVEKALGWLSSKDILIHGGCRHRDGSKAGADWIAEDIARDLGAHVAVVEALWTFNGRRAGPLRNIAMTQLKPDVLYAFPGGAGTASCVAAARKAGIYIRRVGW